MDETNTFDYFTEAVGAHAEHTIISIYAQHGISQRNPLMDMSKLENVIVNYLDNGVDTNAILFSIVPEGSIDELAEAVNKLRTLRNEFKVKYLETFLNYQLGSNLEYAIPIQITALNIKSYEELASWCVEHCSSKWCFDEDHFYFESMTDATYFKMLNTLQA